jgi:hypothetical protein
MGRSFFILPPSSLLLGPNAVGTTSLKWPASHWPVSQRILSALLLETYGECWCRVHGKRKAKGSKPCSLDLLQVRSLADLVAIKNQEL